MFAAIKNNRKFTGCDINEVHIKSYDDSYKQYLKRWENEANRKDKETISKEEKSE